MKPFIYVTLILISQMMFANDIKRAQYLYSVIKCTTCKGQSIKESNSEIANILRNNIKSQIKEGLTDDEILDFLRVRYGDEISYKPRFNIYVLPLFILPLIVMVLGAYTIKRKAR